MGWGGRVIISIGTKVTYGVSPAWTAGRCGHPAAPSPSAQAAGVHVEDGGMHGVNPGCSRGANALQDQGHAGTTGLRRRQTVWAQTQDCESPTHLAPLLGPGHGMGGLYPPRNHEGTWASGKYALAQEACGCPAKHALRVPWSRVSLHPKRVPGFGRWAAGAGA